jgi:hypothetical protein
MKPEQRGALVLVGSAVALGVTADVLFYGRPLGVNVVAFALVFVVGLALFLRATKAPFHQGRRWMAAPLVVFAALFAWHDSGLLRFANALALIGAIALGALRRSQPKPHEATVVDYAVGLVSAGAGTFAGTIELLEREVPWADARRLRTAQAAAVARGLAVGVPFVLLFGALFVAADAVFRHLLDSALPTSVPRLWPQLLIAAGVAWASSGLLRDLGAHREGARLLPGDALVARKPSFSLGATEIAVAIGALDLLFAVFVAVQARYLFGGRSVVVGHEHLTYAAYARHGFFELLAVSALVVPVVVLASTLVRNRIVSILSGVLVLLELVVAASALQRMHVYVDQYGLTELRVYAVGSILWLAAVLLWALATVVRGNARRFAVGVVLAGFAATLVLNAVNPDAVIARTNLDRPKVDPAYLAHLSDDAVPTLVARVPSIRDPTLRTNLAGALLDRRFDGDLLGWNASRSAARVAVDARRTELAYLAGR